jgi:hypothetical protein
MGSCMYFLARPSAALDGRQHRCQRRLNGTRWQQRGSQTSTKFLALDDAHLATHVPQETHDLQTIDSVSLQQRTPTVVARVSVHKRRSFSALEPELVLVTVTALSTIQHTAWERPCSVCSGTQFELVHHLNGHA